MKTFAEILPGGIIGPLIPYNVVEEPLKFFLY